MHIRRETPDLGGDLQRLTVFFNTILKTSHATDEIHGEVLYYIHRDGNPVLHPVKRQTIIERSHNGKKEVRFVEKGLANEVADWLPPEETREKV